MSEEPKVKRGRGRPRWTDEQRAEYYRKKAEREAAGIPAPLRGMGGRANFKRPQDLGIGETDEDKLMIARLLGEARIALKQERPKSDEELKERILGYFEFCEKRCMIPTVEELCLYIGYSHSTVYSIRHGRQKGFSPQTKEILDRMMSFMSTFDAKLAMTGKIRDAVYIFRSKNYYGMRDQLEHTLTANVTEEKEMSREELEQWFLEDGKTVETEFAEEEEE